MNLKQFLLRITYRKWWCSQYGHYCKNPSKCEYPHYKTKDIPKICNALLRFDKPYFVMCEKFENHEGNHRGIIFEWREHDQQSGSADRLRGEQILKARLGMFK